MNILHIPDEVLYLPPNGTEPQTLPDYWKFEDGSVRTDLQSLSDQELNSLGWKGPFQLPNTIEGTSIYTHEYYWNSELETFEARELSESAKRNLVNYRLFLDRLMSGVQIEKDSTLTTGGISYRKIKEQAKISLEANVVATEFLSLISDAKSGSPNIEKIQESILEILSTIPFTAEELSEIQSAFNESGMFAIYTLQ